MEDPQFTHGEWNEFTKLYKVNIPDYGNASYYLGVLSRCPGFDWLPTAIRDFKELTSMLRVAGTTVGDYKFARMQELAAWFKARPALEAMNKVQLRTDTREFDQLHSVGQGEVAASIDLRQANYNIWRRYDSDLPITWEEFAASKGLHAALVRSKSFRQLLFGNVNPKRLQKLQAAVTSEMKAPLEERGWRCIRWSADEVTFSVPCDSASQVREAYENCILTNPGFPPTRLTFYALTALPNLGHLQQHFALEDGRLVPTGRELFGVPGNLMYLALKEHILREPVTKRDLVFWAEGRLAYWDHPILHQTKFHENL